MTFSSVWTVTLLGIDVAGVSSVKSVCPAEYVFSVPLGVVVSSTVPAVKSVKVVLIDPVTLVDSVVPPGSV